MSEKNKIIMVTGANSGIGKGIVTDLAEKGMKVIMACRQQETGQASLDEIVELTGNDSLELMTVDLASLKSIRNFVKEFKLKYSKLHILINNAGVSVRNRRLSGDGFEMHMAVNFFGPFLMTNLLVDTIKASAPARIINVSSAMHKRAHLDLDDLQIENGYGTWGLSAYGKSKLAFNLFSMELMRKLDPNEVTVNIVHPGGIKSNIGREQPRIYKVAMVFMRGPKKISKFINKLALSPEYEGVTGKYYSGTKEKKASKDTYDEDLAKKLWDKTVKLVNL